MRSLGVLLVLMTSAVAGSCGGSDQCSEGCSRMKSCAEKLDCAGLDPLQQPQCNQRKKQLATRDCAPLGTVCPDDVKARFERAASCTLNPTTCECP